MVKKLIEQFPIKFLFFLLGIGCIACHDKEALKQAMIEKIVKERIENHQKIRIANCEKEALEKAEAIADSLLIQAALTMDTTSRINRPIKPTRPNVHLPLDTTPIKPLFNDSVLVKEDSLKNEGAFWPNLLLPHH